MGRNNSEAWDTIHAMCDFDKINEKLLYERSKLVLSKYRKLCWQSRLDANDSINDICLCASSDLDGALIYLETFAPDKEKELFESRIKNLFDLRWMMDIVENAMVKTKEFPTYGDTYFEILSKCYLTKFKYTENELLDILNIERSRFYDRKKEAIMIFGIALWGTAIPRYKAIMTGGESSPTFVR